MARKGQTTRFRNVYKIRDNFLVGKILHRTKLLARLHMISVVHCAMSCAYIYRITLGYYVTIKFIKNTIREKGPPP